MLKISYMEKKIVPTAEEFFGNNILHVKTMHEKAIAFAKLHREAILESVIEKTDVNCPKYAFPFLCSINKASIMNCYPIENIK